MGTLLNRCGGGKALYSSRVCLRKVLIRFALSCKQGADGCLTGLTIVVTGVLESLQREEAEDLIKRYGGKATKSISRNTSHVLAGEDAGPSKLSKV